MNSTAGKGRSAAPSTGRESEPTTIEWNETAAVAVRRMRHAIVASLTVVADGRPIGQVRLQDIERCEKSGNWLDAIMVRDLLHRPNDTCN